MPTLNTALAALERHTGFPQSRSRGISRRLQEDGLLPLGAPGIAPQIDAGGFIRLFVALAADTTVHTAPDAARTYLAMTPGGTPITADTPMSIGRAESELLALVETALADPYDMRHLNIEVVGNWPELAVHWADGSVHRYQPVGSLAGHWGAATHRRAITVTGVAFRDAVRATFKGSTR